MRTRSKKPTKQRKYERNVPFHEGHKLMSVNLSPELREQKGFRAIPVRPKDEVLITRGRFKGTKGKVSAVFPQKRFVHIEKVTMKKTDDSEIPAKIHPSNLMLIKFGKSKDKKRKEFINRRVKEADEYYTDEDFIDEEEDVIAMDDEDIDDLEGDDEEFELDGEVETSEASNDEKTPENEEESDGEVETSEASNDEKTSENEEKSDDEKEEEVDDE